MADVVKTNRGWKINVVKPEGRNAAISKNDMEMDRRAKAAVQSAIQKAEICNKPVAKYDRETGRAYIQIGNGEKKYV